MVLGWPKSPYGFFCKIKFSFSPITLLIWIFQVCWLSPTWYNIDCSQCLDLITINFNWPTQPWSIAHRETSSTKTSQSSFDMFYQSWHLLHALHKSFFCLCFSYIFTFLEIIKHIVSVLDFGHYNQCAFVSKCCFNLYFPDGIWYGAPFHVFTCLLYLLWSSVCCF